MSKFRIITQSVGELSAEITSENPETAKIFLEALPMEGDATRWGEEIYFKIPVEAEAENQRDEMEVGDIAYWVSGESIAIFFGPTPVSDGEKPKAYEPVNVFAKINGDATILTKVKDGEKVRLEATS